MEVGKYHVLVCTQNKPPMVPSCASAGAMNIMDEFRKEIFSQNLEKDVILTGTGCVGVCNRGANVIVYPEGKWYTAVNADDVKKIVETHLKGGAILTDRNDPDAATLSNEVGMFQERIKMMMKDQGII